MYALHKYRAGSVNSKPYIPLELEKLREKEELDRIIVELAKHKDQVEYLE
jgi:hypothetical protein